MKTLILSSVMFLSILFGVSNISTSQSECGTQDFQQGQAPYDNNFIGGYLKPQRTDISNGLPSGQNATLNMLFVFVQFPDETTQAYEWPINDPPDFIKGFSIRLRTATEISGIATETLPYLITIKK